MACFSMQDSSANVFVCSNIQNYWLSSPHQTVCVHVLWEAVYRYTGITLYEGRQCQFLPSQPFLSGDCSGDFHNNYVYTCLNCVILCYSQN